MIGSEIDDGYFYHSSAVQTIDPSKKRAGNTRREGVRDISEKKS